MGNREVWVDRIKGIACILVVLGHFFQSMVKAGIIAGTDLYQWFNQSIYYFHVPLFFICSGYLYQKLSFVTEIKGWISSVLNKLWNLGIPYLLFSSVTLILKYIFKDVVNSSKSGFLDILLFNPTAPYWYLYVLFFIFLVTPTFLSEKMAIAALFISLLMKLFAISGIVKEMPYAINGILNYEIWFVLGMAMSMFGLYRVFNKKTSSAFILFLALSVIVYKYDIWFMGIEFIMGLIACLGSIAFVYGFLYDRKQDKLFRILTKYNFPIYLMHTIFAAGIRGLLIKVGITNFVIHTVFGIAASFLCPIIAAMIMDKIKILNFCLYPVKTVREIKASLYKQEVNT